VSLCPQGTERLNSCGVCLSACACCLPSCPSCCLRSRNMSRIPLLLLLLLLFCCLLHFVVPAAAKAQGSASALWGNLVVEFPTLPLSFPNVDQVGRGCDIYHGNPRSTRGSDPGVRAPIFSMHTVGPNNVSADGRFILPVGFDVYQDVSCRLDYTSTIISSE